MRTSMATRHCFLAVAGFLFLGGSVTASPVQAADPAPLVTGKLVSGKTVARVGEATPLGVLLTIAPGWHIYWLHPGDAGMATQVEWEKTSGARIDGVRWPAPTRFITYETIHANGYEGEVLLPATLTVTQARHKTVSLAASVRWLACKGECIKGSSKVSLTLPTIGTAESTDQAVKIADAESKVPRALESTDPFQLILTAPPSAAKGEVVGFEVEAKSAADGTEVALEALFLDAAPGQVVDHEERLTPTRLRIKTTVTDPKPGVRLANGVAVVKLTRAGVSWERYVQIEFPTRAGGS